MTDYPLVATIRDIVIIVWGVLGIVAFLVVILVVLKLFQLVSPILKSAQATVATVQTTATMVSDVVAKPLIRVASLYVGMRRGVQTLGRFRHRRTAQPEE